jgi:hypothetical protein
MKLRVVLFHNKFFDRINKIVPNNNISYNHYKGGARPYAIIEEGEKGYFLAVPLTTKLEK